MALPAWLFRLPAAALVASLVLSACNRGDPILPGERIAVRPAQAAAVGARPISLPPTRLNADWSHANGTAAGRPSNLALAPVPQLRWATDIGAGSAKRSRLLTAPIVAGGLIYTIDADGQLTAVTTGGQVAWTRSLVPAAQIPGGGPGGGMAVANGVLYVTTGYGDVWALDPRTGGEYWRKTFEGPIRAAPSVSAGRVYVVLRTDDAYALDARDGSILWRVQGTGGPGLLGGSAVATDGQLAIIPFASGEVIAALARNGLTVWGTAVTGGRRGYARSSINDVSGAPVIDGNWIYASNQAGRTVRMDRQTGERTWTMPEGSYSPAWPVGGSVFLMSDVGTLLRVDAATSDIIWSVQLPDVVLGRAIFRPGKPIAAVTHYGPVLAGNRIWVASGDGFLRAFNPIDGALLAQIELPGGAAAAPAVAGGVLYVVTRDGRLLAFQ